MGGQEIAKLRVSYDVLLDPDAARSDHVIDVDAARPPNFREMRKAVADRLRRAPDAQGVEIRVGGVSLGVSTRKMLASLEGSAGGDAGTPLSAGDRASLEGESTQYRALHYACTVTGCPREAFRSFHDARFVPSCTDHDVPMELRGWI
jgi:hypothetical protein